MPRLFHGTLAQNVDEILRKGIMEGEGWGGANTRGVFLSRTPEGALYWAKLAHQREHGERLEVSRFDREYRHIADRLLAVLVVDIPDEEIGSLRADAEQFEDVGVNLPIEDWRESLRLIGDARFDGKVPPEWVVGVIAPSQIR